MATAAAVVQLSVGDDANPVLRYGIAAVAVVIIVTAVTLSKRRDLAFGDDDGTPLVEDDEDLVVATREGDADGEPVEAHLPRGSWLARLGSMQSDLFRQ